MQQEGFLIPNWPSPSNVKALSSLRSFGDRISVTQAAKQSLQLPEEPCWLKQVHGTKTIILDEKTINSSSPEADAAYTCTPSKVAVVLTADCLPILICDENGKEVAAIHAGWRGLAAGVVENCVEQFRSPRENLFAWFGPAISQKAFVVGEDVKQAFSKPLDVEAFIPHRDEKSPKENKWRADLYKLARFRLQALGITKIFGGEHCTYTEEDLFYSYRRSPNAGRMATLIWIN